MTKMSFLEKLGVLLEVSKSSKLYILLIIALIALGIFLFKTNKRNVKMRKRIFLIFLISIALLLIIVYHASLGKMFDYMMNNLFVAIYFPNLAIYFAAIIVTNIILWTSVFSFRTSKIIKRVNIVVYVIMNYLLALILSVISSKKLDIFSQTSIYNNEKVTALISLSSIVFVAWIIYLIIYKIILIYIKKDYKPKVKKVIVKRKVKMLPENFEPTTVPEMIHSNWKSKEYHNSSVKTPNAIYQKVSPVVDVKEQDELTKNIEKMFTLDDYKLLLKMLKEQREKERLASKSKIEEVSEKTLQEQALRLEKEKQEALRQEQLRLEAEKEEALRKEALRLEKEKQEALKLEQLRLERLKEQELVREQEKLTELEMLYRSIR